MSIRLSDVAARSGVSEATVSRVLNRRPGVSKATRGLVLDAVEDLRYRTGRKSTPPAELVGVIAQDAVSGIVPGLVDGVLTALHRRGHLPVLCSQAHGAPREDHAARRLLDRGVAGLIFLFGDHTDTTANHELYRQLTESSIAHVLVGGAAFAAESACISTDDAAGSEIAVRYLSELGHVRTGMILGSSRYITTRRKADSFAATFAEWGVPAEETNALIEYSLDSEEAGFCAAETLLDKGCTALICDSEAMALGAVKAARSRSMRVPDDLSVVVFGDSALARHTEPPLTVMSSPVAKMAESVADALLMAVSGNPLSSLELYFRPDLIIRGSSGKAPRF
ncbi:substrate-binding domain-containing protein (plasmid) [Streptomyces sp. NBC_00868]|uniref:LacI family DNA-binding transcriptional regulator n=1 Tax=Streptomyces sp. NBC_00868 TaxID=2903683 RepID=UPI002F9082D0|nr:substrate-binding domain-containing protein [Streptomyces sp. NBC_00868]